MAEDCPMIENTIHGWITGYYCDRILQEWSHNFEPWSPNHIKLGNYIDSLTGVTCLNKELQYKLELICWLPKLFRLQKQENEESFLEIIRSMDAIKDFYPESLLEETTEFFSQLKKQCILLCSQEVGFVAAKNLYKTLASENELNKVSYSSILGVLKTTHTNQEKLQNSVSDDISCLISTYLKKYLSTVSTPFLVQAASKAVETEKQDSSGIFDSQKEIRLSPELLKP
ncbi:uncharacterized protein LOC115229010 [Octopus sinensis]|uniref:Uncharacterized protein LOC115229010 n=1 Tax=Octopus sinensis TaxID=2607531 RepID=A0A6P7TSQ4_9MOLL|nr:uncharacterized protein LOC115229010 [Octopus sinensis]